jgi:hypothetical protein
MTKTAAVLFSVLFLNSAAFGANGTAESSCRTRPWPREFSASADLAATDRALLRQYLFHALSQRQEDIATPLLAYLSRTERKAPMRDFYRFLRWISDEEKMTGTPLLTIERVCAAYQRAISARGANKGPSLTRRSSASRSNAN